MRAEPILVAGAWREAAIPQKTFAAVDPTSGAELPERYPISGRDDLEAACRAAAEASRELSLAPLESIARFLDGYAREIELAADTLVSRAARETGLPEEPRLRTVELPRTTGQLRQAAAAVRDRSWCRASIDSKPNIRSKYGPLGGPVVVFGPSNFPFAFNAVAGGDFAAAVAAGNPVLAKANPGHPGTSKLFAQCAAQALRASGLPLGTVQLLYDLTPELGLELVGHPLIAAVAFTGSKRAGLTLKAAADRAGKPIYLELSSINPLIVLPGALGERSSAIARELADSCALGAGQFCTKPGLTLLCAGERAERFFEELTVAFAETTPGTLLGPKAPEAIAHAVGELTRHGATIATGGHPLSGSRAAFESTLLRVSARSFLENPGALQTEAFGTVHLVVFAEDAAELLAVARTLEGGLTAGIYTDSAGSDDELYAGMEPVLRTKVGRLLNDKMPTGVAVTPAMNHGGPFPATGHPGFTAVGIPASLLRFAALHCYDGVRPERLPEELRDENPTGKMWRLIDGAWSQQNVER